MIDGDEALSGSTDSLGVITYDTGSVPQPLEGDSPWSVTRGTAVAYETDHAEAVGSTHFRRIKIKGHTCTLQDGLNGRKLITVIPNAAEGNYLFANPEYYTLAKSDTPVRELPGPPLPPEMQKKKLKAQQNWLP